MFAQERHSEIYDAVQKNGAVTSSGLVSRFGVSVETIRKDLLFLEKKGLLARVHGGAVANTDIKPFSALPQRRKDYNAQKSSPAARAAEFICDGDIIGIDAGSIAAALAEAVADRFCKLTVITHSQEVFEILRGREDFTVILCGGYYLRRENAFCGAPTLTMLGNLHMQKAFIFPSALSLSSGIFDYQNDLFQVQKLMMKSAESIYVLADSSKFEKKALHKVSDMRAEYYYVTDAFLSDELKELYKENNIQIFIGE